MKHKIMFEDRKICYKEQQIKFSGHPFVTPGNNLLNCTHGVNHHLSRNKNVSKKTIEGKVTRQCSSRSIVRDHFTKYKVALIMGAFQEIEEIC